MVTVVVMVGDYRRSSPNEKGHADPVAWVEGAKRAAAADLVSQLANEAFVERVVIVSPRPLDLPENLHPPANIPLVYLESPPGEVHVGDQLAGIVEKYQPKRLLYFGGGSAPLMDQAALNQLLTRMAKLEVGVITNNTYASDWAGMTPATVLTKWSDRLPQDNMLGWVLSTEAGLTVHSEQATASYRLDIDTPTDLLTLRVHPNTSPLLKRFLDQLPLNLSSIKEVLQVMATPASHVFVAGRLSPGPWRALNDATQCWIRVVSEERGMVSSGRLQRGETFSFLADYIDQIGLVPFFSKLADRVQAALIDTRVLLAHHGSWPPAADRFASDLGLVDQIEDPWLRDFTAAAMEVPIPILLGGHGLLSGDLLALCDLL